MCGIYKITNTVNGKCYIGQSIDIAQRFRHHRNYPLSRSNYPLYKAFREFGIEKFTFEIIEECESNQLDEKEIFYIKSFNSYNDGYNQTRGGSGSSSDVKLSDSDILEIYDLLLNSEISQKEISIRFNVGQDTISEINHGKTRRFVDYSYPLRSNLKWVCQNCGEKCAQGAILCQQCESLRRRKAERPSRQELKNLIRNTPFTKIGEKFGVSDNAIRKWCDSYNLPRRAFEIKRYSDFEWDNI